MKKRTNIKLELNKQKISELSDGNLGEIKGGSTSGGGISRFVCPPPTDTFGLYGCGISARVCVEKVK